METFEPQEELQEVSQKEEEQNTASEPSSEGDDDGEVAS